jgi:hypothetical protein
VGIVRIEQWLARGAHVPKGVGSNPTSNNIKMKILIGESAVWLKTTFIKKLCYWIIEYTLYINL